MCDLQKNLHKNSIVNRYHYLVNYHQTLQYRQVVQYQLFLVLIVWTRGTRLPPFSHPNPLLNQPPPRPSLLGRCQRCGLVRPTYCSSHLRRSRSLGLIPPPPPPRLVSSSCPPLHHLLRLFFWHGLVPTRPETVITQRVFSRIYKAIFLSAKRWLGDRKILMGHGFLIRRTLGVMEGARAGHKWWFCDGCVRLDGVVCSAGAGDDNYTLMMFKEAATPSPSFPPPHSPPPVPPISPPLLLPPRSTSYSPPVQSNAPPLLPKQSPLPSKAIPPPPSSKASQPPNNTQVSGRAGGYHIVGNLLSSSLLPSLPSPLSPLLPPWPPPFCLPAFLPI